MQWKLSAVNGSLAKYFTQRRHARVHDATDAVEGFWGCDANIVWASVETFAKINASVWIIKQAFTVISPHLHYFAVLCSFKDSAVDFCNLEQYSSEGIIYSQEVNSGMWCCWDAAESTIDKVRQQFLAQIKCAMLLYNTHVVCVLYRCGHTFQPTSFLYMLCTIRTIDRWIHLNIE